MHNTPADTTSAVDAFMAVLEHPAKAAIVRLRAAMLASDGAITEGVKWNAPSFKVDEYFATMQLRLKVGVGLVLHFGAKVRHVGTARDVIHDPDGLLNWLARDRAMLEFRDVNAVEARAPALQAIVRQWIGHL